MVAYRPWPDNCLALDSPPASNWSLSDGDEFLSASVHSPLSTSTPGIKLNARSPNGRIESLQHLEPRCLLAAHLSVFLPRRLDWQPLFHPPAYHRPRMALMLARGDLKRPRERLPPVRA